MRIPDTPPNAQRGIEELLKLDMEKGMEIMRHSSPVDSKGRYLHWDEFQYKKPPGRLKTDEWWMATRLARQVSATAIPLRDINGQAFSFNETASLRAALRDCDMNAGGNLGSDQADLSSGEAKLHLRRSLAEEPFASSLIEGAATTRRIAKQLIFEGRQPRTKDELMVLNNYRALELVKSWKADALTLPMLLQVHRVVTVGTLEDPDMAGKIRQSDDVRVVDDLTGDVLYSPPLSSDLPTRLDRLIRFANESNNGGKWIHPILRAFMVHFALSYEHPFVDGNGRVARALFYWLALRYDYWLLEYVSISSIIAESSIKYGQSFLYVESDSGDLTYFFLYHSQILSKALTRLSEYMARKKAEVTLFEQTLHNMSKENAFNHRQSFLLNELIRSRIDRITIDEHQQPHGVSYLTARNDLESLCRRGLMRKMKVGRRSFYLAATNLTKRMATAT